MKKIHRFLVQSLSDKQTVTLTERDLIFQIATVLKLKPGEHIILFTPNSDDYVCELEKISKKEILLQKKEIIPRIPSPRRTVIAAVSIIKRDLFELVVQKLTELGVQEIIPLLTDRTVKQAVRTDRMQAISDEALELCGGNARVMIREPLTLSQCLDAHTCQTVFFDQEAETTVQKLDLKETVLFLIGPEGGWNEQEKQLLTTKAQAATLGTRTLRAETASIVAAYQLLWIS